MGKNLFLFCFWIFSLNAQGQQVKFRAFYGAEPIHWATAEYHNAAGEKFRFSNLSFYISDFSWYAGEDNSIHEHQRVELLQASADSVNMLIKAPFTPSRFCFRFGLDSATQVSGRTDGALDPALGMYWAWNTGYIQCRLEGQSPDSKGKKGKFEFHLGGYASPWSTDYKMCIDLPTGQPDPEVILDLKPLMDGISLRKSWSVLTPGKEARDLSFLIGNSFRSSNLK
jgi:hypothetical protein